MGLNTIRMKNKPETKQSLVERYDCGPVKLSGDSNALYERFVAFDHVVAETETTASRSRNISSQRAMCPSKSRRPATKPAARAT